jgi:hypothetical protein
MSICNYEKARLRLNISCEPEPENMNFEANTRIFGRFTGALSLPALSTFDKSLIHGWSQHFRELIPRLHLRVNGS